MKPNYEEIGDILEMLEIAEVKNISILNFIPQGRGKLNQKSLQLSAQEFIEFTKMLESYGAYYSGNIRIGTALQEQNDHICNAGLGKFDISSAGIVFLCPALKHLTQEEREKYNIREVNITENLEELQVPRGGTRKKPLCKEIYRKRAIGKDYQY